MLDQLLYYYSVLRIIGTAREKEKNSRLTKIPL